MARFELDALDLDIAAALEDVQSPTLRSVMLAEFARSEIAKADQVNASAFGAKPARKTYVDRAESDRLEMVRPDGTIVAIWSLLEEVVAGVGDMLRSASPVGSDDDRPGHPGLYRASHILTADGDTIEWQPGSPLPGAAEYAFVNSQPYARKIERGLSAQAPAGVYQTVAGLANGRFGNIARITFDFRAPYFGAVHGWAETTAMASPGRMGAKRDEWLRRQPAVIIRER